MTRARITLRLPLSPDELAQALRFRALTAARVIVKPRERRMCREVRLDRAATIMPPPFPTVVESIPPQPVTEATPIAPSLPTVRPPRRSS